MRNIAKFFTHIITLTILFTGGLVLAQSDASQEIAIDEDVQAEDLGVSEPKFLPDNSFYYLKELAREIQGLFTFNPTAKAGLRLKFSGEKLLEAKKLVEKKSSSENIEKAMENYRKETENVERAAEKIKDKASGNPQVGKFLDKFIKQQILHQTILEKLEEQVPPQVFEKLKEAKEKHLEKFGQVMAKLEDKTKLEARLQKNLDDLPGSKFKHFRNLMVLKQLEEKVPEGARDAVKKAQENALLRIKKNLEEMSPDDKEKFNEYLEKISGNAKKKAEILDDLRSELKNKMQLREGLIKVRAKILEKVGNINCPALSHPDANFCKDGRIVVEKDEKNGCLKSFRCVIPGEFSIPKTENPEACIALWDPVCGKNGRTYSNECFAKMAGVQTDHIGACQGINLQRMPQ